ncbi:MAG: FAD-dependent oxidoreductase [Deltaproteobacteria bacterium]
MTLRSTNVAKLGSPGPFDVLVLGGGINGAVSAACMSARGARVALIDRGDFAGFTSQQSSNLAWGGIKYLETFEFGLVRKLCRSRNLLIRSYPSVAPEIRFFTTHTRGFRHGRLPLYLGTLFYWFLGSFFTRRPRLLSLETMARDEPVVRLEGSDGGFEYSDSYFHDNDARFTWSFIRGAMDHGCVAANYIESTGARRDADGLWTVDARDVTTGRTFTIRARALVNACGPYVDAHNVLTGVRTAHRHALSKGIHLIVRRLTPHRRVLTFFADDGRLFFVIPMGARTCIGTTDTRVESPETHVTDEDRRFVLENINKRLNLAEPLTEADVIAERCGVRPLAVGAGGKAGDDWMRLSRKHAVETDEEARHVSVFGGKLTDCLNVGDEIARAVARLGVRFPYPDARWYGEPHDEVRARFFHQARLMDLDAMTSPASSEVIGKRLWRRYGYAALAMLEAIREDSAQGEVLIDGTEYLRCELEHAARHEMVTMLDDFLRRRSKIALVVSRDELMRARGLDEACKILFGEEHAMDRWREYFGSSKVPEPALLPTSSAA